MDYLAELLKEQKQLLMFPNLFPHITRLLDEEILRARSAVFKCEFRCDSLTKLPDPIGDKVQLTEKVFVPIKEHPDYNFVGRILGPRGMTAKQLEQETGCKIMIRGKGSLRDQAKEDMNRGKPNYEHLNEDLHVLIQCEDTDERAKIKLENAVAQIKSLLELPSTQGIDELKRKQLMELSIINGTYRSPSLKYPLPSTSRLDRTSSSSIQQGMFSPGFLPQLPAFFDSPLSSPMNSNNSSAQSFGAKPCSLPKTSQETFDFNLNDIIKSMGETTLEAKKKSVKKNPWLQDTWRSNSNGGNVNNGASGKPGDGSGDVGSQIGYAGRTLVCQGCGAIERA